MDYTIKIGGEAGQGIQTIGDTISKVFSRMGYHVFTHQDYESRVRGGHNFYQVRLSETMVTSSRTQVDILVALDKESIKRHERELGPEGIIVYDASSLKERHDKPHFLDVPFNELSLKAGGSPIMANMVAIGAILGMIGINGDVLHSIIKETMGNKGEAILKQNIDAFIAGRDYAKANCLRCSFFSAPSSKPKMLIDVNEAIGLGAIASGCKFYTAYPMTPSTGILNFFSSKAEEYGIVVEQAEDEISAINMALGASYAGVRSMTGTSGGGFCLMVEGISLAGMTEIPIVVALAQRPAPATGLPTRTEQADLFLALHAGHGEFPRVIFAPGDPEQAFYLTNKAFDLSNKYQIPVFILTDQYLSDSRWTYLGFDLDALTYRAYRLKGDERVPETYKRFAYTEDGVSPLAIPGKGKYIVVVDSDEHDEEGHIIEDGETRRLMVEKRLFKKLPFIKKEMESPRLYGSERPDIVVIGWGSTYGIIKEAVDELAKRHSIAMLHFSEVYPFPYYTEGFMEALKRAKLTICVEQNGTNQFARLLKAETGFDIPVKINRYDGRPFLLEELIEVLNGHIGRL
ncbi:MAG: 2-oxoacid:acceptor oxidoreductase subunit alpha [Syntrophorhabdaceae bacterium]|nr:2-oxoacid:acceptor oxidoreductase subunit alpha [Syntrophorhabdaceae bacterium]